MKWNNVLSSCYLLDMGISNIQNNTLFKAIKIPVISYKGILLLKNIIALVVYAIINIALYKSLKNDYIEINSIISFVIIVGVFASTCLSRTKDLMIRYNGSYWNSEATSLNYLELIINTNMFHNITHSFSLIVISFLSLLVINRYCLLLTIAISSIFYSFYTVKFYGIFKIKKRKLLATIFKNTVSSILFLIIGYSITKSILGLMQVSRNVMIQVGMNSTFIQISNNKFNQMILHTFHNISAIFNTQISENKIIVLFISIVIACIGVLAINTLKKHTNVHIIENQRSVYVHRISKFIKKTSSLSFKDYLLLTHNTINYAHSDFNVLCPTELLLLLGMNLALLQVINNPYILISLLFIEIYVIIISAFRNIVNHFVDVFEYKEDIQHIALLKQLSILNLSKEMLNIKIRMLQITSMPSTIMSILILLSMFIFKTGYLFPIIFVLSAILFVCYVKLVPYWIMKPYYDCFGIMIHTFNASEEHNNIRSIRDYKGFSIIKKANDLIVSILIYICILVLVFLGFFPLITGHSWIYICICIFVSIPIAVFISVINLFYKGIQ